MAAWLRQILANSLAQALRRFGRQRRNANLAWIKIKARRLR
jgi:hypothetical protein